MKRWVLLRGLMRDARHWGDFPLLLGPALAGAEVLCIDLPGNGQHNHRQSPCSIRGMVEACRRDPLLSGHDGRLGIVAMSLGAMVATEWATRYPEEIGALVLINTSMRPFSTVQQRLLPRNYATILRLLLGGPSDIEIERAVLAMTSRCHDGDPAVLSAWCRWRKLLPVSRANVIRQMLAAASYRAPTKPPAPTLLLASAGDSLVSTECSRSIARHWGAPILVHPDAGHDLPLDDAVWVVQQIEAWQPA